MAVPAGDRLFATFDDVGLVEVRAASRGGPRAAAIIANGRLLLTDRRVRWVGDTSRREWRYDRTDEIIIGIDHIMHGVNTRQTVSGYSADPAHHEALVVLLLAADGDSPGALRQCSEYVAEIDAELSDLEVNAIDRSPLPPPAATPPASEELPPPLPINGAVTAAPRPQDRPPQPPPSPAELVVSQASARKPDPASATGTPAVCGEALAPAIARLVADEQLLLRTRLDRLVAADQHASRSTVALRAATDDALDVLVERGMVVVDEHEQIWDAVVTTAPIRPLGARRFSELPPTELQAVCDAAAGDDLDGRSRAVQQILGLSRLTASTRATIERQITMGE